MPEQRGVCDCGCGRTYDDIIDEAISAELIEQIDDMCESINRGLKDIAEGRVQSSDWLFEDDDDEAGF